MRMINGDELLAARAHFPLCGKEIVGRGFVSHEWVGGKVASAIKALRLALWRPSNQPAAFVGNDFACVRDDFTEVS